MLLVVVSGAGGGEWGQVMLVVVRVQGRFCWWW